VVGEGEGEVLEVVLAGADDLEDGGGAWGRRGIGAGVLGGEQGSVIQWMTLGEGGAEEGRGGGGGGGHGLGRAGGDDAAAGGAGLGPDFEEPVGGFEHVEVVLDDDEAVAAIHDLLQDGEQALHVVAVQSGGGFVQEEQGARREAGGWLRDV